MRGRRLAEWGLAHTYKGPLQQRRVNDIRREAHGVVEVGCMQVKLGN